MDVSTDKRVLRPEVISRIERLTLLARKVSEGVLTGLHRSVHHGASLEFADHKPYSQGDDPRLIDWKAYAKTDRYTIKQFEDETNVRAAMVLDSSASMEYGSTGSTKLFYGCVLLASLAYILIRQRDAVGFAVVSEGIGNYLPPRGRASHLQAIIELMAKVEPRGTTSLARSFQILAERLERRSMIFIASDLFDEPEDSLKAVKLLAGRGHEVTVFHLLDPEELRFPFDHQMRFEDMEGPLAISADPRGIREEYLRQISMFMDAWKRGAIESGVDYILVDISEPSEDILHRYLADRGRRKRK
jgi:uncharacterized protein (DUF58 family)